MSVEPLTLADQTYHCPTYNHTLDRATKTRIEAAVDAASPNMLLSALSDVERDEYTPLTGTESRQAAEMPALKALWNGPGSRGPKPRLLGA